MKQYTIQADCMFQIVSIDADTVTVKVRAFLDGQPSSEWHEILLKKDETFNCEQPINVNAPFGTWFTSVTGPGVNGQDHGVTEHLRQ